jgi:hypothetical protein
VARKKEKTVSTRKRTSTEPAADSPPINESAGRHRLASALVLGYFVLLFGFMSISSLLQKSPTIDEPAHLFSGYSYLKWGDFRANPEHPPLAKMWAALPLLAFDIKDPRPARPHWDLILENEQGYATINAAEDMLFVDNNGETLFFYARLQMVLLGMALGIFVYRWSKELFGFGAAAVALFLFAFDPNILAHSQVVHTDVPFAAFFFAGSYFFWRALGRLTRRNLLLTALFFALASATKYSYWAILLAWAILGAAKIFSSEPLLCELGGVRSVSQRGRKTIAVGAILAAAGIAAYLFTWAVYGFRYHAIPGGQLSLTMAQVMPPGKPLLRGLVAFITDHHLFPEAWIYGQLYTLKYLTRPAYLLGEISPNGFLGFFPVVFAVKTPLPALILLIASAAVWTPRRGARRELFLLVPVVVYFSLAIFSRINIGLRHILPIYPFLFVLLGGGAAELWSRGGAWVKRGLVLLAVWHLWSSIAVYPHYLAFFNELAGGASNGHEVTLDSNLDWGQDLKGLKLWMDAKRVKKIKLLYFGYIDPEFYEINATYPAGNPWLDYDPPAIRTPETAEYLAISATLLYGSELFLDQKDPNRAKTAEFVRSFRWKEPVAIVGHSIRVYRLDGT